jgi:Bacterial protein of unknown function (DUF937)
MGLFFEVLNAINSPNQQANVDQLSTLTGSVQQLAGQHGVDSTAMQLIMSSLGGFLRPALQQQGAALGGVQLESLIGQLAGGSTASGVAGQFMGSNESLSALQALLPPHVQQEMIQGIARQTGMNPSLIQGVLPSLVPMAMNFLHLGANAPGSRGLNPILKAFLDGDRAGNTDLGDMMKFASRFLNAPNQPN